jgi:hypothetical protein
MAIVNVKAKDPKNTGNRWNVKIKEKLKDLR